MSEIDLSKLSAGDLVKLAGRLEEEQVERWERARAELRERWAKEAEAAGFSVAEVLGQKKRSRAKPGPTHRQRSPRMIDYYRTRSCQWGDIQDGAR